MNCLLLFIIMNCRYTKRQWQLLENQIKYDAEQKEKAQKEAAASQAQEARKSRLDGSDSDEELAKGDAGESFKGLLPIPYL